MRSRRMEAGRARRGCGAGAGGMRRWQCDRRLLPRRRVGGRERRPQRVGPDRWHAAVRQRGRLGLPRSGGHLLRLRLELHPALRPVAGDVQVGARRRRRDSWCPTSPSRSGCPPTTRRPGPTSCARASSSRTARPSPARTSSTRSSARWTRRPSRTARRTSTTSSTCRATPAPTRTPTRTSSASRPSRPRTTRRSSSSSTRRSAASTTSPSCRPPCRCRWPRTPARSTRSTWSPRARTCSRRTTWARASRMVRNPNWDQATDPNRKPLPDRDRGRAQRQRRRHRQPAAVSVTSTSTWPAAVCSRPRRARSWPTRRSRPTPTRLSAPGSGTPRSTAPSPRWTTSTAARPSSWRRTRPATSAPTAARPAVTSPPT